MSYKIFLTRYKFFLSVEKKVLRVRKFLLRGCKFFSSVCKFLLSCHKLFLLVANFLLMNFKLFLQLFKVCKILWNQYILLCYKSQFSLKEHSLNSCCWVLKYFRLLSFHSSILESMLELWIVRKFHKFLFFQLNLTHVSPLAISYQLTQRK